MPEISVIIPAYNAERTIKETLESVLQQTFSDFEVIIINDGSTDKTAEIVTSISDERMKLFNYENCGLPTARNRGISIANARFIAFLDADDLWTPDKLELQRVALIQNPKAGLAYSWTYFMDDDSKSIFPGGSFLFEGNVQAELLINNFIASGSNPLIRAEAIASIGEFEPTLKSCEDWEYWLRLSTRWDFVVVPKHQIFYRQSSDSMSSKVEVMEAAGLYVVEKAFQAVPAKLQHLKNQSLARFYQYCAQKYLHCSSNNSEGINLAGKKLWRAMTLYPPIFLEAYGKSLTKWYIKKWIIFYCLKNNYR